MADGIPSTGSVEGVAPATGFDFIPDGGLDVPYSAYSVGFSYHRVGHITASPLVMPCYASDETLQRLCVQV